VRRSIIVLFVVLTVLLTGCVGIGGPVGDEGETQADEDGTTGQPEETAENESAFDKALDGELEIHHIDVGQADATLLISPDGETVLIDTGDWRQSGQDVLEYLDAHQIDRVDHLVATHAHADHIGGHDAIIAHYETERDGIGAAYDSGVAHASATYDRYLDAIEEHDVDLFEVQAGDELPIETENFSGTVLNPPEGESGTDLHYNSVTILFEFGTFTYLTTGDAEADAEQRMEAEWGEALEADGYHAGHHGSSTSSTPSFIAEVKPSIAVISSNYDSQYGHPHDETLETFAEFDVETYWTGVHGDIVLTTDGQAVTVQTAHEFSTDPLELLEQKPREETDSTNHRIGSGSHLAGPAFETASAPIAP